jgi:recombination protein RecA
MLAALSSQALERAGIRRGGDVRTETKVLPVQLGEIDAALPEGGFPRGSVVEIASDGGLSRATSLALATCASAQAEARLRGGEGTPSAWCAWVDASRSLNAPAVRATGVDLGRLLVVAPEQEAVARAAVRVASSRAFAVVVVDAAGARSLGPWATAVRRLAIGIEGTDTLVVLLTDARAPRSLPLPVAMRVELERPADDRVALRVAKHRSGRVTNPTVIAWPRSA